MFKVLSLPSPLRLLATLSHDTCLSTRPSASSVRTALRMPPPPPLPESTIKNR